jgi:uncharacterized SAM-binding protein YcdF (DUF218 family)
LTDGSATPIAELRGDRYVELLAPIWSYLTISQPPVEADVVFAFGCASLDVPLRAANLVLDGLSPRVLVTGGVGSRAGELYGTSEAEVFSRHLAWLGVPPDAVVAEDRAANTGENVVLGMRALLGRGIGVRRALLVAKPFVMRRCAATFRLRHPPVETVCCPPPGGPLQFAERSRAAFAARLLGELDRLERYPAVGFIAAEPPPPPAVSEAAARVRRLLAACPEEPSDQRAGLSGAGRPRGEAGRRSRSAAAG